MLSLIEMDLLRRSHDMKREMFVELSYKSETRLEAPVLLAEQIGEENFVSAYCTKPGSYVCHTHINNNPPSDMDYIMMLRSTLAASCIEHRVITDELVYSYSCSVSLFRTLKNLVETDNVEGLRKILFEIKQSIAALNADYKTNVKFEKRSLYIRAMKDLGINLSIRDHTLESIWPV